MKPRDVIDLEAQLAADEAEPDDALRARDRQLYLAMSPAPREPDRLLEAWLERLRAHDAGLRLGEQLESGRRVVGYALALLGFLSGWGVAEALLRFDQGGAPINVGHYLLVLVFGQLALLVLLLVTFALRRWLASLPVLGDVQGLLRLAWERISAWLASSARAAELEAKRAAFRRARTRFSLYGELERYLLLSQTQLFSLAFNLGALSSCLRLILLSDLAFAWSTSIAALDVAHVERICALLAAPFGWLVPDAVPSQALIEHTQYYRLEGRFAGAETGTRGDPALAAEWWRFLIACTITYGLLPRVVTFVLARVGLRRAEQNVPLDTPAVQRLLMRMTTPALSTRAREAVPQGAEPSRRVEARASTEAASATLVIFRDIPSPASLLTHALMTQLAVRVVGVHHAGGADARMDGALGDAVAKQDGAVCVVAEAWEAPDKSLRELLARLRSVMGPRRSLRVLLIGEATEQGWAAPAREDVQVYRDRSTLLEDPYLSVEALERSA